ncbi:hypothetical protein VQ03_10825 [Methylobacterium tarhaniae]|uniref:Uncharacterized protein n=1 Tax=Methylobacterium tarhaniae TaxID=1187852 RepID=A0A0J6T9Y9_9HYPH|nr:hypothetical protein [Methylobacterium tarhaniae]KMO42403.1 hypothetical protein VQ03_10825 [Methylobacterium tarhaniae]
MGLQATKAYSAKDIQSDLRNITDDNTITVEIKELGHGNATLLVNGTQLASSFSAQGSKIVWAKAMQPLIKDVLGGDTINWANS